MRRCSGMASKRERAVDLVFGMGAVALVSGLLYLIGNALPMDASATAAPAPVAPVLRGLLLVVLGGAAAAAAACLVLIAALSCILLMDVGAALRGRDR